MNRGVEAADRGMLTSLTYVFRDSSLKVDVHEMHSVHKVPPESRQGKEGTTALKGVATPPRETLSTRPTRVLRTFRTEECTLVADRWLASCQDTQ